VAAIEDALEGGQLGPQVQGIMYDNERWPFTPIAEQRNPAWHEKMAAHFAHRNGLLFLAAPAVDLVGVLAPTGQATATKSIWRWGSPPTPPAMPTSSMFRQAERDTRLYGNFVRAASVQARQSNPKALVLAGVSTNPNGQR
jgi:hypothetical protein